VKKTYEAEVADRLMGAIRFVSYDGAFPNLCSGTLVIDCRGKRWTFSSHALSSGGGLDSDYIAYSGSWRIHDYPDGYPEDMKKETEDLVNEEIPLGCCGGCS